MNSEFSSEYSRNHLKRFERTLKFLEDVIDEDDVILDLGPANPFSRILLEKGYKVDNTPEKTDLDLDYSAVTDEKYTLITSFELFEHLVSPFPLLKEAKAKKLVASVPLRLWFSTAYWNEADPYDRHYHEFEPRQFNMLLEKAGWRIEKSEKWISKSKKLGIRPFLRNITPRYYIVYCTRV